MSASVLALASEVASLHAALLKEERIGDILRDAVAEFNAIKDGRPTDFQKRQEEKLALIEALVAFRSAVEDEPALWWVTNEAPPLWIEVKGSKPEHGSTTLGSGTCRNTQRRFQAAFKLAAAALGEEAP